MIMFLTKADAQLCAHSTRRNVCLCRERESCEAFSLIAPRPGDGGGGGGEKSARAHLGLFKKPPRTKRTDEPPAANLVKVSLPVGAATARAEGRSQPSGRVQLDRLECHDGAALRGDGTAHVRAHAPVRDHGQLPVDRGVRGGDAAVRPVHHRVGDAPNYPENSECLAPGDDYYPVARTYIDFPIVPCYS